MPGAGWRGRRLEQLQALGRGGWCAREVVQEHTAEVGVAPSCGRAALNEKYKQTATNSRVAGPIKR